MKASEFRIGNCVNFSVTNGEHVILGQKGRVTGISGKFVWVNTIRFNIEDLEPVPLTKEIVRDWFGFKKAKRCEEGLTRYGLDLVFIDNGDIYVNLTGTLILYVHQLQNFIFAVSGTEPDVKLPNQ